MTGAASTSKSTFTTPSDTELLVTRTVRASRRAVFDAWTTPRQVQQWMLGPPGWTMPVCEIDLRPGGSWRFVWRKSDGAEMAMIGSYREVSPPDRLVSTESWGPAWPETINTLVLTESGADTLMSLTITYPSKEARDAATQSGMKGGMESSYDLLEELLVAST